MRNLLPFFKGLALMAIVFAFQTTALSAQDVKDAAPGVYKLVADSLKLRVFEVEFEAGETAALHSHPESTIYVVQGGTLEVTDAEGKTQTHELKTGTAMIIGPTTHSAKNVGKKPIKLVVTEIGGHRH